MRVVTLTSMYYSEPCKMVALDTLDDLVVYIEISWDTTLDFMQLMVRDKAEDDVCHFAYRAKFIADVAISYTVSKIKGISPKEELENISEQKFRHMKSIIEGGQSVLINKSGGYSKMDKDGDDFYTVLEEEHVDGFPIGLDETSIRPDSKFIVLENSRYLPRSVYNFIWGRRMYGADGDDKFSAICDLSNKTPSEIEHLLKDFEDQGGRSVFAETTGLDKKQLLGIAGILINHTSLRDVKIVMTRPMDNDIQNLLKEISDMGLRLYITECGQKTSWRLNE